MEYTLEDAFAMAILHSQTFEIPSNAELRGIKIGDHVKLCFIPTNSTLKSERMWVKVKEIYPDGTLAGELDQDPFNLHFLKDKDRIEFHTKNIYQILEH